MLVSHEVEVSGAGESEHDGLFFAGFFASEGFVDGSANGVAAFGGRQDAFDAGKLFGSGKHRCLLNGARLDESVVVELREDGAHAVESQAAGVVG